MIDGCAAGLDYRHTQGYTKHNTHLHHSLANYLLSVCVYALPSLFCTIRTRAHAHTQNISKKKNPNILIEIKLKAIRLVFGLSYSLIK